MSKDDIQWAVDCWFQQVSNRPIKNIHRRTLDDTWRMVIRRLGGDDIALIGPSHDGSLAAQNIIRSNYEWETSNSEDEITRLRAQLHGEIDSNQNLEKAYQAEIKGLKEDRESLRAELEAVTTQRDMMREALKPFSEMLCYYHACLRDDRLSDVNPRVGDLRRARAALEGVTKKEETGNE